jgi:hypothetical protein
VLPGSVANSVANVDGSFPRGWVCMQKDAGDQVKQFRKAARELGCDESEERFQEALRAVAKQQLRPTKPKKGKAE